MLIVAWILKFTHQNYIKFCLNVRKRVFKCLESDFICDGYFNLIKQNTLRHGDKKRNCEISYKLISSAFVKSVCYGKVDDNNNQETCFADGKVNNKGEVNDNCKAKNNGKVKGNNDNDNDNVNSSDNSKVNDNDKNNGKTNNKDKNNGKVIWGTMLRR